VFPPSGAPPDLPSFPTRRSSDLAEFAQLMRALEQCGAACFIQRAQLTITRGAACRYNRFRCALDEHVSINTRRMEGARLVEARRSEEHTSELQSLTNLVCRLLLE